MGAPNTPIVQALAPYRPAGCCAVNELVSRALSMVSPLYHGKPRNARSRQHKEAPSSVICCANATFPKGKGFWAQERQQADIESAPTTRQEAHQQPPRQHVAKQQTPASAPAAPSEAEGAEREADQIRPPPRPPAAPSDAGFSLFDCLGKTQGRRGLRQLPDRFARPPYSRTEGPAKRVPLFVIAVFSSTGRGAFSFVKTKENGGRIPRGNPRPRWEVISFWDKAPPRR